MFDSVHFISKIQIDLDGLCVPSLSLTATMSSPRTEPVTQPAPLIDVCQMDRWKEKDRWKQKLGIPGDGILSIREEYLPHMHAVPHQDPLKLLFFMGKNN